VSASDRQVARVLVVDDSAVARAMLSRAIHRHPGLEVQATAADGVIALARFTQRRPDIVVLDVEMPEMDGLETLTALRRIDPEVPVVMFSLLTSSGADVTLEALARGATDYVCKPSVKVDVGASAGEREAALLPLFDPLLNLLGALTAPRRPGKSAQTASSLGERTGLRATAPPHLESMPPGSVEIGPEIVAIGSSTGGPQALESVLTALAGSFPLPVVVTQHIPPVFSTRLAERLNRLCALDVVEATDGDICLPGHVYIAPGDRHLLVTVRRSDVVLRLDDGPPVQSCRPSVDIMFRSIADCGLGAGTIAAVLTGMGADGLEGSRLLKQQGAAVLAQDEATSVVWGMPGYVAEAGVADAVLPIWDVAAAIEARVGASGASAR